MSMLNSFSNKGFKAAKCTFRKMLRQGPIVYLGDDSESDGYLYEDSGCAYLDENGSETNQDDMDVDNDGASDLLVQNREFLLELTEKKKLERLQKKGINLRWITRNFIGALADNELAGAAATSRVSRCGM
ncbi:hypothetical protein REPUB_Repub08aG0092700 [Reevesia pubescens]